MKNLLSFLLVIATLATLVISGCKKDNEGPVTEQLSDFNLMVRGLPQPNQATENPTPQLVDEEEVTENGVSCTIKTYSWAPGYVEPILMNPSSDVIFPGSILKGTSLTDGSYTPIIAPRRPLTFSTSLENVNGNGSISVDDPKLSTVREAIKELLSQEITGDIPANMVYESQEIHSSEQLKLAIGGNYDGLFTDVEAQFDFNDQSKKSRYIVNFVQVYYSLDVDHPESPAEWFETPPSNVGNVTPVYVSSVKYGRMAMLSFESTAESTELKAAVKATFNALVTTGEFETKAEHQETFNKTEIKALVVGGSADDGVDIIQGTGAFGDWVKKGATYDENSSGAPLAYTMRFLNDNSLAKVILAGEYDVRECDVLPETMDITINRTIGTICPVHIGGDREFDGNGPEETASARLVLSNNNRELSVEVIFHVKETDSDWTEGSYVETLPLYTAPNGFHIANIKSDADSECYGIDDDHSINRYDLAGSELVDYFDIMGDTGGDDLPSNNDTEGCEEYYSYLKVIFNPIDLVIQAD